ncbi:YgcG family protein [Haloimpatiens sp. FM7315]|uniref:TPM domain-containing protein n=1 Tax=Haloimpatiens sp. FM7315 TaxID=3298609 RepID=UPI0035A3A985
MKKFKNLNKVFTLKILTIVMLCFCFFMTRQYAMAKGQYPNPTELKYVNDYADMIDENTKENLVSTGKELEDKTGAQLVVVTIKSLGDENIEDYANKLFRKWGIGEKNKDNGLLILISKEDRKWKVEVGTGLEGAITDIYSSRVMNDEYVKEARKENYSEGIKRCYGIFTQSIAKEYSVKIESSNKVDLEPKTEPVKNKPKLVASGFIMLLILIDIFFNKGRMLKLFFYSSLFNRGRGPFDDDHFGGGSSGGFGGGSSSGGGSSGSW